MITARLIKGYQNSYFTGTVLLKFKLLHQRIDQMGINFITLTNES